jgi:hypothetical protein
MRKPPIFADKRDKRPLSVQARTQQTAESATDRRDSDLTSQAHDGMDGSKKKVKK